MSKKPEKPKTAEKPCGLIRRMMIIVYDGLAIIALLMLATLLAMLLGMENKTAAKDPFYTAGLFLVWFLYLGWCWNRGGMTLGMRAWRVRIQNRDGENPGWRQCLIRFLASFLSVIPIGLGFIWSLFRSDRKTWHDLISKTHLLHFKKGT